jgi:formyltetrahydrofolate-dependent phosphoribosylglycinamide formyltransferase
MMTHPLNMAVLLSGGGRTLQNFIDLHDAGKLPAKVSVVVSSRPEAHGLARAEAHGIPAACVPSKRYEHFGAMSEAITTVLDKHPVDLIALAGFMCLFRIPPRYLGRVMNIHPALLPAFCGKGYYGDHVHAAVLRAGCKVTGATVHFANNAYDKGPIIVQRCVPVLEDDTVETLGRRVFELEKRAYPEAIRLFAEGRLKIEDGRCRVLPPRD